MYKTENRGRLLAYGRWVAASGNLMVSQPTGLPLTWEPPTDIYATGDKIVICLELAGIAPEAIDLVVEGRRLRIAGERRRPPCYAGECAFSQAEINYGPFERVFEFPESLEQADLRATCTDGFLTIEVRAASPGPRRIVVGDGE